MLYDNSECDYAVIDLETTGLSDNDRIVELGVVLMNSSGEITDVYETLIRPLIPMGASEVHEITEDMVRHAPTFEVIYPQFLHLVEDRKLVAHNANFEARALQRELTSSGIDIDTSNFVDTLKVSRQVLKKKVANHKLNTIANHYKLGDFTLHHALNDAYMTALVLQNFIKSNDIPSYLLDAIPVEASDFQNISFNSNLWLPRNNIVLHDNILNKTYQR